MEGLSNKARVITKRHYGLRNTHTLWNRLCLDVNLTTLTVPQIHEITNQIRTVLLNYYTCKRKSRIFGQRPLENTPDRRPNKTPDAFDA